MRSDVPSASNHTCVLISPSSASRALRSAASKPRLRRRGTSTTTLHHMSSSSGADLCRHRLSLAPPADASQLCRLRSAVPASGGHEFAHLLLAQAVPHAQVGAEVVHLAGDGAAELAARGAGMHLAMVRERGAAAVPPAAHVTLEPRPCGQAARVRRGLSSQRRADK